MTKHSLSIELRVGESASIDGGRITVTLEDKSGQRARLKWHLDSNTTVKKITPDQSGVEMARRGVRLRPA